MSGGRKDAGRLVATGIVALVVVGVLVALRPDRWFPAGTTAATRSPLDTSGPTLLPPAASTWRSLSIAPLPGGPAAAGSIAAWSGGYVALGPATAPGSVQGWTSIDGRAWAAQPELLAQAGSARAVAALGGVVVALRLADASVALLRSGDATTWDRATAPELALGTNSQLAGRSGALVGVIDGDPNRLGLTADGATWQLTAPPGIQRTNVLAVAELGGRFVAVGTRILPVVQGSLTAASSPRTRPIVAAWWSADGLTWQAASMADTILGSFVEVHAGASGLVAISSSPGAPNRRTYWQSSDGLSWAISDADPLGVVPTGEAAGSVIGRFTGDGNRLLVDGAPGDGKGPVQFWSSSDGLAWTQLDLTGDAVQAAVTDTVPFLLRDGVLLVGSSATWIGVAAP